MDWVEYLKSLGVPEDQAILMASGIKKVEYEIAANFNISRDEVDNILKGVIKNEFI